MGQPSPRSKTVSRWVVGLSAVASIAVSLLQTPVALREMREDASLTEDGAKTQGRVVSHDPSYGKYAYRSTAIVGFRVNDRPYEIQVRGSGALPERLRPGTEVEVHYLPNSPSVSRVVVDGARTNRFVLWQFAGIWLLTVVLALAACLLYWPKGGAARKNEP
jgi:hypothetical protein